MSPEEATLLAGVVGAILGGLTAGGVQIWMSQRERRARRRDAAIQLLLTAMAIRNQTTDLEYTIELMGKKFAATMPASGRDTELWEPITPLVGSELVGKPAPGDMLPLIEARAYELIRDFNMIVSMHQRVHAAIEEYSRIRREMAYELSGATKMGEALLAMPEHKWERFAPQRMHMSSLIRQILAANARLKDRAAEVTEQIGQRMAEHFNDRGFPQAKFPDRPRQRPRSWWMA